MLSTSSMQTPAIPHTSQLTQTWSLNKEQTEHASCNSAPPGPPLLFLLFSTFLLICSVNTLTSKWTCHYYVSLIKSHLTGPGHWFNRSCTFSSSQNFKSWASSQSHGWMKIRHTRWYGSWNCTNTLTFSRCIAHFGTIGTFFLPAASATGGR